jgi:hypothetical protein
MMQRFLMLVFILWTGLYSDSLNAQNGVATSGNEIKGSGGSATYSVGQVFYKRHSGSTGSYSQGLQQAYEISVFTAQIGSEDIKLSLSAYPIPVNDILMLDFGSLNPSKYNYELVDIQGRLVIMDKITNSITNISMGHLIPGTYFLNVQQDGQKIKSFKIIKN